MTAFWENLQDRTGQISVKFVSASLRDDSILFPPDDKRWDIHRRQLVDEILIACKGIQQNRGKLLPSSSARKSLVKCRAQILRPVLNTIKRTAAEIVDHVWTL